MHGLKTRWFGFTLPRPGGVNRLYPSPAFLIAMQHGFGNAGMERFCAGASNPMLLRNGPDSNSPADRRAMRRFGMRLPSSVRVPGIPTPFPTETENVSARGIFFYIDRWMKQGATVEVTMDFPSQMTLADPLRVRFVASVVRIELQSGMRVGVAAAIDEYEFLSSEEDGSAELQPGWSFGVTG